ncbi:hypothetical protein ACQ5SO_21050 [Rhodovulum sp. DZ06]|uniref:hypothetical protein n=1 Tax=Rhodovulum sp. DZ06 TaxID=3425126 RepID=UPI003D327269
MLDDTTFLSVWYWALAIAIWSEIAAYTYGVPARQLHEAQREGGEAAALTDALARRFAARADAFWRRTGAWSVAGAGATVGALCMLAFAAGSEIALGLLLLVTPTAAVAGFGLHEALLVHKHQPSQQVLLEVLVTRRRINIAAGVASISATALLFVLINFDRLFPFAAL